MMPNCEKCHEPGVRAMSIPDDWIKPDGCKDCCGLGKHYDTNLADNKDHLCPSCNGTGVVKGSE